MDWYIVIKTIKGHRYRYRQRTWREGKHVRTESVYLGPVGGDGHRNVAASRDIAPTTAVTSGRSHTPTPALN